MTMLDLTQANILIMLVALLIRWARIGVEEVPDEPLR